MLDENTDSEIEFIVDGLFERISTLETKEDYLTLEERLDHILNISGSVRRDGITDSEFEFLIIYKIAESDKVPKSKFHILCIKAYWFSLYEKLNMSSNNFTQMKSIMQSDVLNMYNKYRNYINMILGGIILFLLCMPNNIIGIYTNDIIIGISLIFLILIISINSSVSKNLFNSILLMFGKKYVQKPSL